MAKRGKTEKGNVGEVYVMFKLIRDFNIKSVKVPQEFFSYDLITSNNWRLEVKTGEYRDNPRPRKEDERYKIGSRKGEQYKTGHSYGWAWRKTKKQHEQPHTSDFVICLGYPPRDLLFRRKPVCFIIPSEKFWGRSNVIRITANPSKGPHTWWEYENRWDYITRNPNPNPEPIMK
jgi:hypothetical protein